MKRTAPPSSSNLTAAETNCSGASTSWEIRETKAASMRDILTEGPYRINPDFSYPRRLRGIWIKKPGHELHEFPQKISCNVLIHPLSGRITIHRFRSR